MHIRLYQPADHTALVALIAAFRVELAALRRDHRDSDSTAAAELQDYLD